MTIATPYEELLREVMDHGTQKTDRTGTGTRSVFGRQLRFDLAEGFPLITTKRVHFKSLAYELLWFLRGDSNVRWLQERGVKIWDEWADANGDLGPVYSSSWRAVYAPSNTMVQVPVATDSDAAFKYPFNDVMHPAIECGLNTDAAWAIEDLGAESGNRRYRIQLASGFVTEIARPNWKALRGDLSRIDGYSKSVVGVGFQGRKVQPHKRLYTLWRNMMARCYDATNPAYEFYGARGVTVSPIWHSFEFFTTTINRVPGFHLWNRGDKLELDKDYLGAGVYSPTTAVFLPASHNITQLQVDGTAVEIAGEVYASYTDWADGDNKVASYAKGRWDKGFSYKSVPSAAVKTASPKPGYLWRKRVFFDQVAEVIEQIRNTPDSRRLLVSAWNVGEVPSMALPPCHALFQFYVADGKLSCQLYQRSADMFLGVPFNIASYALLTHMIAEQAGLEVGEFVWTGGDCHIYDNHIDQVELQLSRDPFPAPTLTIEPAAQRDTIFDYEFEDFVVHDYQHHAGIKAPVAV